MSIMFLLKNFLAVIIFFLLLFLIFVFIIFTIFADLISSSSRNEHLCCKIIILHLICLNIILIINFIFIFSILAYLNAVSCIFVVAVCLNIMFILCLSI